MNLAWLITKLRSNKIIVFCTSLVLVLVLLRITFAHFYHDKLREIAIYELDKSVTAEFSFKEIDFSLLRNFPNITGSFNDLALTGTGYFEKDTLAHIEEIRFEVNLFQFIMHGKIELESLHLEKPILRLLALQQERNYSILNDSSSEESDANLKLDRITVKGGQVYFAEEATQTVLHMKNINYRGNGKLSTDRVNLNSELTIGNLSLAKGATIFGHENRIEANLQVEYEKSSNKISFSNCKVAIDRFILHFNGSVTGNETTTLWNVAFESGTTSFNDILTLHPALVNDDMAHIKATGNFDLKGTVAGTLTQDFEQIPNFDISLKIEDGSFKVDTLALPVREININLEAQNKTGRWLDTKIDLKSFRANLGNYPLRGRFKMEGLVNPHIDADIISKIKLEDLEKIIPVRGVDMKGTLAFEFKANGKWAHDFFAKKNSPEQSLVPPFQVYLELANGNLKYDALSESFDSIQFKLEASNTTGFPENTHIVVSALKMKMNDNPIRGFMQVDDLVHPTIKGELYATLKLDELKNFLPMEEYELKGDLDFKLITEGTYHPAENKFPAIDAKLAVSQGFIQSSSHVEPIENIELKAELKNETGLLTESKLIITQSDFVFEDEPISVKGTVFNFRDFKYDIFLDGKTDLGRFTKFYPIDGVSLKGIVDAHLELRGTLPDIEQKNYTKLAADGQMEVRDFFINTKSLPEPLTVNEAFFEFATDKIVLKKLQGKVGSSSVEMKGDLFHYMSFLTTDNELVKADLFMTFDTLNLERWLAEPAHVSDSTKTKTKPWLIPRNLLVKIDLNAARVKHPSITISDFSSDLLLRGGIANLTKANFKLEGGEFHLSGHYNPYKGLRPFFDFAIDITNLDIQKTYENCKLVRDMAPAIENTTGIFSGNYSLQGLLNDELFPIYETIYGNGVIRIANARINGMKMLDRISKAAKRENINDPHLKDLVIETEIKNNQLLVKPFSLKVSGLNTDIEGYHDFTGILNYIVKIELLPIEKLKIPFHVTGNYDDPKIELGKGHTLPDQ